MCQHESACLAHRVKAAKSTAKSQKSKAKKKAEEEGAIGVAQGF
jgi:hypothetical protein